MGLFGRLKNAGQRVGSAAHEGLAKVRYGLEDAEGRMRQRMRIYPKRAMVWGAKARAMGEPQSFHPDDQLLAAVAGEEPVRIHKQQGRKAIVSVNGRDVDAKQLDAA